jgi:hypothetical protein
MSTHNRLEEEFERQFSSENGAWANAWSPTWEDTSLPRDVSFGNSGEDFPEKNDSSAATDQEEPE